MISDGASLKCFAPFYLWGISVTEDEFMNFKEENPYDDLLELHERRIHRAGLSFWTWLKSLDSEKISGDMAMKIRDHYGFRALDVIFLCEMKGVKIDVEEFIRLLNEEYERSKDSRKCCE